MAEKKQLVLVVESTSALEPYWSVIYTDYLVKIIRSFCADGNQELALVKYNFREAYYSSRLLETSSWTDDMDAFMKQLCSDLNGDMSTDAPIEEALAEALKLFSSVKGIQNPQRHCILIAATNPTPIPENHLPDAETVAKSFPESMISLSVISPKELLKLRAIYAAAKRTPLETGFTIDMARNEDYLVLISESLTEVWAAFSQSEIKNLTISQSPIEMYAPIHPESPPIVSPESVQEVCDMLNEDEDSSPPTSVGNYIPPPTSDPSTVYSSMVSGQTSSPLMSSLKESSMNENVQNSTPVVPNILNSLAHSSDLLGSLNVSNIIAGGGMTPTPTEQPAESATLLPGTSGTNEEAVNILEDMVGGVEKVQEEEEESKCN